MQSCVPHPVFLASAVNLERELFKDLMKGYNKHVRPTEKSGDVTQVDIKMTLTNLISLVSKIESPGLILTGTLTSHSRRRCFKISVLQNEKEEALTTSVWIELVVQRHQLHFCFPLFCCSGEPVWCLSWSLSSCSNGVTTGSAGTSRPGPLCTGTSPNLCASPPGSSGCQISYWRTSE